MKKTLFALLALGCMAVADEPVTYTFTTATGAGANRSGGCAGIAFQLSDTSRMDVDQELPSATLSPLFLESITITASDTMDSGTTPLCLFIIDSDYKLMAVSSAYTPQNIKSDQFVFDFSSPSDALTNPDVNTTNLALTAGTQYYAFFLNASRYGDVHDRNYTASIGETVPENSGHPWADSNTVALSLISFPDTTTALENAILNGDGGKYDGLKYNQFGAVMNIVVKTPEPATATLSLLALAGLAARRRRH